MFEFELLTVENFVTPKFVARTSMCAVGLFKKIRTSHRRLYDQYAACLDEFK